MERIELIPLEPGARLDAFVSSQVKEISRSRAEALIQEGQITVNGSNVLKSFRLSAGDRVTVDLPLPENPVPVARAMPLSIVYEDEALLVLDKPKGMVVHPAPGHTEDTLVNGLLAHCGQQLSGINGEKRPGIVHRIDKDTSGLLVIAKNDLAHQGLSKQFEMHSIDRAYEAVVFGQMPSTEGTINAAIGRCPKDRKKMAVVMRGGKRAVTHYEVLRQYCRFAHLACRLETGRTHQIRVHMASIGHFVLGDLVYGRPVQELQLDFEGQCLHAKLLGFIHPITGEHLVFESPLPEYFKKVLTKLQRME